MSKFKVGDKFKMPENVDFLMRGEEVQVISVERDGYAGAYPVQVRGHDDTLWLHRRTLDKVAVASASQTKEQRAIARKEAELAALKAAAAKKAQQAVERKAKAERAKLLRALTPAGKRVVAILHANKDAFGCQRDHAISLAAAITGDDADKIRKAIQ